MVSASLLFFGLLVVLPTTTVGQRPGPPLERSTDFPLLCSANGGTCEPLPRCGNFSYPGPGLCLTENPLCCYPSMFTGPSNKIWSDSQCPVPASYKKTTLDKCMTLCVNTKGCTAINYSDDVPNQDGCVLRGCSAPVPLPDWDYPPYKGYVITTAMFTGPSNKIWSDNQCPVPASYKKTTLDECTTLCVNREGCTAINFSEDVPNQDGCVLRACSVPVPRPDWDYPPYKGYVITTDSGVNPIVAPTPEPPCNAYCMPECDHYQHPIQGYCSGRRQCCQISGINHQVEEVRELRP